MGSFQGRPTGEIFIWNSPEFWTELKSGHSVQFSSGQKKFVPASRALSSVQFRSKKRGRIFWTRINAQKRSKNAPKRPKTPQNAPKRPKNAPKTPQNAPKTPVFWTWKRPFFSVQFSSGQFFQVRSVQVNSGQFRSSTWPDRSFRSVQFRWISPVVRTLVISQFQRQKWCKYLKSYLPRRGP